jgi:hypothetical protein
MNSQFWINWIGVVTVGYIILLPGVIFLAMKAAQKRQAA